MEEVGLGLCGREICFLTIYMIAIFDFLSVEAKPGL